MSDLVERLCTGTHPVEVSLRPERTIALLRDCVDRGYVHIKFTDTKGGTELGVRLDKDLSRCEPADLDKGAGTVRFVGGLTLDYQKVRCVADVDLETLRGTGHLERVTES